MVERWISIASGFFLAFFLGFLTYHFQVFPYSFLREAGRQGLWFLEIAGLTEPHYVFPARYPSAGAHIVDSESMSPGYTLITSVWRDLDWSAGVKLLDRDGSAVHEWKIDASRLGFTSIGQRAASYVHGSYLAPDGDLFFNVEYQGLARVNSCGEVQWVLERETHHSLARADDGSFWASAVVERNGPEYLAAFPGLQGKVFEDHALHVSAQGKVLQDINLLEIVYRNDLQRVLPKLSKQRDGDIFHLNDVEPLSTDMAAQYPLFAAGDLVVSFRNADLVFVMSPETGRVKWHVSDPFIGQHDPDFIGEGWIGVFDNNSDFDDLGRMLGGSRIVAIEPTTGELRTLYHGEPSQPFYADQGGKWQKLPNGNLLTIEATSGRAFEVTDSGKLVWEWIQERYGANSVPAVLEATRYPYSREQIANWPCTQLEPQPGAGTASSGG